MGVSPAVAVVGAGNVGHALAADLALRGVEVRLFNRSAERLEPIRRAGGITVSGGITGFARLGLVTESLADAVAGADVVALTLPTAALPAYADALAETTTSEQIIWLNPGHSGGGLYLAAAMAAASGSRERKLCQLTTASHVSRMVAPGAVRVFLRPHAAVAALPPHHLGECHQMLDRLLPGQFDTAATILEVDLANINAVIHPPGMVCNAGWIEASGGAFGFYSEGAGPAVAHVMDAIDRERLALAKRLEVPALPLGELLYRLGFRREAEAADAAEAIAQSELIYPIRSPPTLDHRYLHEDVGWGLVPWMQLGAAAQMAMPTAEAVTHLASLITGVDYLREGLNLERAGVSVNTLHELRAVAGA
jgi:opine dehydrogenase